MCYVLPGVCLIVTIPLSQYMTQIGHIDRSDGRLDLTASAFNQLGQYTSSPGRRSYCYAELTVFFLGGGRNHRQYSFRQDGMARLSWPEWLIT